MLAIAASFAINIEHIGPKPVVQMLYNYIVIFTNYIAIFTRPIVRSVSVTLFILGYKQINGIF